MKARRDAMKIGRDPAVVLAACALLAPTRAGLAHEELHRTDAGNGPPVVIVPWLAGGAFGFRHVAPALVDSGYRVIIVEPLGVGSSARPTEADYSLDAQTDRIATELDALGVRGALVVGHGLGGAIALRLACERPDLVRALVSIEGGPAETAATPGLRRAMRFSGVLKLFATKGKVRRKIRQQMVESSADPAWVRDEVVEAYATSAVSDVKRTMGVLKAIARSKERRPLEPRLDSIRCPVELLVGDAPHPGAVPEAEMTRLRANVRDCGVTRVPGAGHFIQEERPQAIVEAVRRLDAGSRGISGLEPSVSVSSANR